MLREVVDRLAITMGGATVEPGSRRLLSARLARSSTDVLGLRERRVLDMNLPFLAMNANGRFVPTVCPPRLISPRLHGDGLSLRVAVRQYRRGGQLHQLLLSDSTDISVPVGGASAFLSYSAVPLAPRLGHSRRHCLRHGSGQGGRHLTLAGSLSVQPKRKQNKKKKPFFVENFPPMLWVWCFLTITTLFR